MKNPGKKLLSLLLSMVFTLALVPTAFADQSTTTNKSASIDQNARTEMYVVSSTPGSDYVYYGAKGEPNGGVYFGRITQAGTLPSGRWGVVNQDAFANESIVGYYYSLGDSHGFEYWKFEYGSLIEDGKHVLLVNLNFPHEKNDLAPIVSGTYDSTLTKDFQYMNTLNCQVLVRIGGEMNAWFDSPTSTDASNFINAYRHIVDLLHANAPKAAAVFSPNFTSADHVDMDMFYPGDSYVDWVGCSLYFHHEVTDYQNPQFRGSGPVYGDPMLNVQQCANLSALHKKPLIITEGGSTLNLNGDHSAFVSERLDKEMSFLAMVYPQIKGIVSSTYKNPHGSDQFDFSQNATATAGYQHGVNNNPTLLHAVGDTAAYYTKASSYTGAWTGTMKFAAYTYASTRLTATWSLDGNTLSTATEYPYSCSLDISSISAGKHTLTVTFSNGQTKSQEFTAGAGAGSYTPPATPSAPTTTPSTPAPSATPAYNAMPTANKLYVDSALQNSATVYTISGNNYFKLRDVALMLNGSARAFSVTYDASLGAINITTGQSYVTDGSEMKGAASGGKNAVVSSNPLYINGVLNNNLTVYTIDGNNYFKLRDLGEALNFFVGWDAENNSVIVSGNAPYMAG